MLAAQPASLDKSDEELRAICIWSSIGHGELIWLCEFDIKVLIIEIWAVDTFSSSSITSCKVTTLNHEGGNDSMEWTTLVI